MNKELENLIKELNNGKLFGATSNIAKWLNISHVAVSNWLKGKAFPSEDNIEKIAKKTKRNFDDIKKIFEFNVQSKNIGSFNNATSEEIKNYKERIKLLEEKIAFLEEKITFYKGLKK